MIDEVANVEMSVKKSLICFTGNIMSLMINSRNKSIYALKRIFMHNLVGIKCTSEVLGVRCNGKAHGGFFFSIYTSS